jgi:hypothetical protein
MLICRGSFGWCDGIRIEIALVRIQALKGTVEISFDLDGKLTLFDEVDMGWDVVNGVDDVVLVVGDFFADIVELF